MTPCTNNLATLIHLWNTLGVSRLCLSLTSAVIAFNIINILGTHRAQFNVFIKHLKALVREWIRSRALKWSTEKPINSLSVGFKKINNKAINIQFHGVETKIIIKVV